MESGVESDYIDHGDGEAVDHGGDLGAGREAEDS